MSQRGEIENKFTVTCPQCKNEWIYPGRKPGQKRALCPGCRRTTCPICDRIWVVEVSANPSKQRPPADLLCESCKTARLQELTRERNLLKGRMNNA